MVLTRDTLLAILESLPVSVFIGPRQFLLIINNIVSESLPLLLKELSSAALDILGPILNSDILGPWYPLEGFSNLLSKVLSLLLVLAEGHDPVIVVGLWWLVQVDTEWLVSLSSSDVTDGHTSLS